MKICSSQFDAYCEVFERVEADDGAGGQTITWTSRGNMYVLVTESNAAENLDRDGLETQRRVVLYTQYRTDIQTKDRITLDSKNYNITSITRVNDKARSEYRGKFLRIDTDVSDWFGI
jgi:SPP1 family predicted phage head-tail adaptor